MSDALRLSCPNKLWLPQLLMGVEWPRHANLFYIGMQDQIYTYP